MIPGLIDKRDTFELVTDRIGEILVAELANQRILAQSANLDPAGWDLRVFVERSNPWDMFAPDTADHRPLVNVWWDQSVFDGKSGDLSSFQRALSTFNVDCYGYGVARDVDDGHIPADMAAAAEAKRAVRLVRNVLMNEAHFDLGLPGFIWRRFVQSATAFQPQLDYEATGRVQAVRLALGVQLNEHTALSDGVPAGGYNINIIKRETGQLLLRSEITPGVDDDDSD